MFNMSKGFKIEQQELTKHDQNKYKLCTYVVPKLRQAVDKYWTSIGTYKQTYTNYIKLKQTLKKEKMFKINFNFLKNLKKYQ